MNSNLEKLVKNLTDDDFKYLAEEFGSKHLELLKQKDAYPYDYMNSSKRFSEKKLPDKECFYNTEKVETADDIGKKLDGYISDEEYLMCQKIWDKFDIKDMGDYHGHYLKKRCFVIS